jgi:hypothetical protein
MTVKLATRPVLSQPESVGWSRTAVFCEFPQNVSPENRPVWMVAVSTESPDFEEKGIELLNLVEQTYHSLELKSAEALFQTLSNAPHIEHVSIAAVCITLTTATMITKHGGRAVLVRSGQTHMIIENQESEWRAIEGNWQKDDVWWLQAGGRAFEIVTPPVDSPNEIYLKLGEEMMTQANRVQQIQAGLLVHFTETSIEQTAEAEAPQTISFSQEEVGVTLKKRRILILGLAVLILLIVSVFFGSRAREGRVREEAYESLAIQVDQSISVATALHQTDQVRAREQMRTTMSLLESTKEQFGKDEKWMSQWQALYDKANQVYQGISGETSIMEVPVWYPLTTIKADFAGSLMVVCDSNIVVWDEITGTLVKIDAESKRNDIVAGGADLAGLRHIACDGNRAVVLANAGIIDISLSRRSGTTIVETDSEWLQPELVGLFNNNIYLVDPGSQMIFRYPAITGGVGAKQNWFGSGVTLSGTDYVRMAIDGQLWLLQSSGQVSRYTRGAPQSFSLTGLDQPLGQNTPSFAVDPQRDQVAILDTTHSRVVIAAKNGEYKEQVVWEGFATANDIAFSPNQDTLFVLNSGNIYAIDY